MFYHSEKKLNNFSQHYDLQNNKIKIYQGNIK
jgi:hypothetical protein